MVESSTAASSASTASTEAEARFAQVAVPIPLAGALTYRVPEAWLPLARPGTRVRVPVGKKRHRGVILGLTSEAPTGFKVRPIEAVLDARPLIPEDLLELAGFTSEYYLAPIGEVVRALLPTDLPAWSSQRVQQTDAGALASPRSSAEGRLQEVLREHGTMTVAALQEALGTVDLATTLTSLAKAGRLRLSGERKGRARYKTAYELPPGELAAQLEACGRSPKARAAVDLLAALQRPATADELAETAGASEAVLRRLVKLGVLRKFTQVERLSLDRHLLGGLGEGFREQRDEGDFAVHRPDFELRPDQDAAVEHLEKALTERTFAPLLLQGMTGSGKTEVYLRATEAALAAGRGAILMVPEIALVPSLGSAARERFGSRIAFLHSALSKSERLQEWERIRNGEAPVVVGPRSAIFAPLPDVGLIVVDEEQDSAYKQEVTPRYHGRDLALVRGRSAKAAVLLVSATPSLESRHNAATGKYRALQLTERVGQGRLPEGILVDLKEVAAKRPGEIHFSPRLSEEIEAALSRDRQIILLRNRRGYSPLLLCRACGEDMRCDDCGLPRTYHRKKGALICHYCGSRLPVPKTCPSCEAEALEAVGSGTERLEEQFQGLFPNARVDVLDRDAVRSPGGAAAVLERFASGETQVLVGTQMVSKGHHFPRVSLTAVMAADTYLGFPDFRAVERTYNLLTQLAGRAGRGDIPGKVVIQTYHPDHYAIRAALDHDDAAFAAQELHFRRVFHYPPYTRMVQLLLKDRDRERGEAALDSLARRLSQSPLSRGVRVVGPAPAPLERLKGLWRFQLLLRGPSAKGLRSLLESVLPSPKPSELTLDVDPQDLL